MGAILARQRGVTAPSGLPTYVRERLAGNQNFINQSTTLTVGPAEGAGIFVIGAQEGAPLIDLYIVLR